MSICTLQFYLSVQHLGTLNKYLEGARYSLIFSKHMQKMLGFSLVNGFHGKIQALQP